MADKTTGNCYLCGLEQGKIAMKNHFFKIHDTKENGQECCLLKIESCFPKGYWLYIDIPVDETLLIVDEFLRKIWLECCGHCSQFFWKGRIEISQNKKLKSFAAGDKFYHEYDFGTTTETIITVIGNIRRKPQKNDVRLLARNIPPVFQCADCKETAEYVCRECFYGSDNPFYCSDCREEHECGEEMFMPVTNSPRSGECGYGGELDTFTFNPAALSE